MVRGYITSAVAGALLLGLTTAALAVSGEFGNMWQWVPHPKKTHRPTAPSMRNFKARPIASAVRRPWPSS